MKDMNMDMRATLKIDIPFGLEVIPKGTVLTVCDSELKDRFLAKTDGIPWFEIYLEELYIN